MRLWMIVMVVFLVGCGAGDAPPALPTLVEFATETALPTETSAPTNTVAPSETALPSDTPEPTATDSPTDTAVPTEPPSDEDIIMGIFGLRDMTDLVVNEQTQHIMMRYPAGLAVSYLRSAMVTSCRIYQALPSYATHDHALTDDTNWRIRLIEIDSIIFEDVEDCNTLLVLTEDDIRRFVDVSD